MRRPLVVLVAGEPVDVVRRERGDHAALIRETVGLGIVSADPLLEKAAPPLRANATHVDTVQRLPEGARVLARSRLEPHAAVRFSEAAWGVQFHPEMDRSIVRHYLVVRRDVI